MINNDQKTEAAEDKNEKTPDNSHGSAATVLKEEGLQGEGFY